jgi:mRNA-degrading endonuclease RelE of RelBE toxin-antitoxin system
MVTKPFLLIYAPIIRDHLLTIDRKYYSLIQKTLEEQLGFEPDIKTANRKPLQFSSKLGEWEMRFGPNNRFRVICKFSTDRREVYIGAIGEKKGNRFFVGGEEVEL